MFAENRNLYKIVLYIYLEKILYMVANQNKKHQSVFICEVVLFFHIIYYFFSILN